MSKWHIALATAGAAVLLVGCSSPVATAPPTATGASPSAASTAPIAPKVTDPLPASVFDKHPCDSGLTSAQLKSLFGEVPPARHTDNAAGPGCGWTKESTVAVIDVAWMTGVKGGLSQVYQAQQEAAFHQPTDVDGYPALFYNPTEQPTQMCGLAVAISDTLVFDVSYNAIGSKVSRCDGAKQIAQDVLANLRATAGR